MSITKVVELAKKIASGDHELVRPGMAYDISEAAAINDVVWQGDVGIALAEGGPPSGYVRVENLKRNCVVFISGDQDSIGSRHCLEDMSTVSEIWVPKNWNEESLNGPYLKLKDKTCLLHPKHGDLHIPSCHKEVQVIYPREYDIEQKRARRAAD